MVTVIEIITRNQDTLEYTLTGLLPCNNYTVQILPITREVDGAAGHVINFRTLKVKLSTPTMAKADFVKETNKIRISWSEVECATGYKITQMIEHSESVTGWTVHGGHDLFITLSLPR